MTRLRLLPALALFAACTPRYGQRVPDNLVDKLPYDIRIEMLEAENDLAVAIDHVDEVESELLRARNNIRRAKDKLSAAKDEVSRATDDVGKLVADLAVDEADAQVDYLRARQKLNVANEEIEQMGLRCAFARFEQARLGAARKAKVEGSERLVPEEFDQQVKDCQAEVVQMRQETQEKAKAVADAKVEWEKKRTALAKKTFDARASPYVE